MGVLKWVDWTVSEPRYFQLQTDHTPVHLALLDEISTCHQLLHPLVLQLLVKLFETEHSQLDVMEQLELKKTLLDRMVHLLSRGYVLPVVGYIRKCLEKLDTDISLIRYFVTEVLDVIAPPYTSDFVQLFLPILENESIAGTIKTEGEHDPVTEFIEHIMQKARLDESQVGIKIAGRNINNLRYTDDATLMAESEEELKSLLMRVKSKCAKVGLKLNIKKTWHPILSPPDK
ncbi:Negative elongation factor D [Varanus komodoensis]|nr:Negative elongation factor D [Varanus komodoensis]